MIGESLGKYRLERELGSGGMGEVYLAQHETIGKRVAIKVLRPEKTTAQNSRRFFNEARAAAKIEHPGMVEVIDFGTDDDGRSYLVMEYLEGQSLAARISHGPLDEPLVIELIRQAASAIAAAHRADIVHRDLKPQNLFLTVDEAVVGGIRLKVLDFGIAKLRASDGDAAETRTGEVFGTPLYMSPEQCRGAGEVGPASDIYSLGAVLYEMVTRRPPFVADGPGELISDHLRTQPVAPRERGARISAALETLIMSMLAKRPTRRPSAGELVTAIDDLRGVTPGNLEQALGSPALAPTVESRPKLDPNLDGPGLTATALADESDVEIAPPAAAAAETVRRGPRPASALIGATIAALVTGGAILVITRPWQRDTPPEIDLATATAGDLRSACNNKRGAACTELGRRMLRSERVAGGSGRLRFDLAFPHYLNGCDLDDAAGCTAAGELYESGNGVAADPRRAVASFERACRLGDDSGCAFLGYAQLVGAGTEPNAGVALETRLRACELGSAIGCREAATQASVGLGTAVDQDTARRLFDRALELGNTRCDEGDRQACTSLGVQWFNGYGVEKDPARGFALMRRACDLGELISCTNMSQAYILGLGAERDPDLGLELAEKACEDGSREGCEIVSIVVGSGYAGEPDHVRAREIVERECKIGPRYCGMLANELVVGNFLPRDRSRALEVARRACDAGTLMACKLAVDQIRIVSAATANGEEIKRLLARGCESGDVSSCVLRGRDLRAEGKSEDAAASFDFACRLSTGDAGCSELGELHVLGEGVVKNIERGLALMEKACDGKAPGACRKLALLQYRGRGVEKNPARAVEVFLRGCDQLDDRSCLHAATMLDEGRGVTADHARAAELRKVSCARLPNACKPDAAKKQP